MAGCWRVLDPFYSRPTQYAQDLMSEITATRKIQHSEYEKLFEYYALIRGNITEARKANLEETLLTQANIALMEHPLPTREIEEWRSRQAKYAPRYHADAFVEFVYDREEWALKNVAYSTASRLQRDGLQITRGEGHASWTSARKNTRPRRVRCLRARHRRRGWLLSGAGSSASSASGTWTRRGVGHWGK